MFVEGFLNIAQRSDFAFGVSFEGVYFLRVQFRLAVELVFEGFNFFLRDAEFFSNASFQDFQLFASEA